MLHLVNDFPFISITTSWHIFCKFHIFINGQLLVTIFFIFRESNSRIDLYSQHSLSHSLFFFFNAIFVIKCCTNTIKSLQLIESVINQKTFGSIPSTKFMKYLILWQSGKRRFKFTTTFLINKRIIPFSFF